MVGKPSKICPPEVSMHGVKPAWLVLDYGNDFLKFLRKALG